MIPTTHNQTPMQRCFLGFVDLKLGHSMCDRYLALSNPLHETVPSECVPLSRPCDSTEPRTNLEAPPWSSSPFVTPLPHHSLLHSTECCTSSIYSNYVLLCLWHQCHNEMMMMMMTVMMTMWLPWRWQWWWHVHGQCHDETTMTTCPRNHDEVNNNDMQMANAMAIQQQQQQHMAKPQWCDDTTQAL